MKDENLGLVAGSFLLASATFSLLDQKTVGFILAVIGIGFAVVLGLSKRAQNRAKPGRP